MRLARPGAQLNGAGLRGLEGLGMSAGLVGQHQQTLFASPINGDPGDATVVLGNDNATVATYDAHDSDATIHVQSSSAAVFNATPAGVLGRKWMTNDTGAVYLYYDTGSAWVEINYQRTASTGAVVIVSTSTPQLTVEYDGSHTSTFSVSSGGALTVNATSTVTITPATTITGALTQTGLATFNGGGTIASGQTLTVTGATITGLTAASVTTGTFPGAYTITGALTLSAALTYGGVTLSNAVTGTGNMVLSASPTITGTLAAGGIRIGSFGTGAVYFDASDGLTLVGKAGSALDFAIFNPAGGTAILSVPTGTTNVVFAGALSGITTLAMSGTITVTDGNISQTSTSAAGTFTQSLTHATYTGTAITSAITRGASSAFNFLNFSANGVSQFSISGGGVLVSSGSGTFATGLAVSSGTTAVQALTATSGAFTAQVGVTDAASGDNGFIAHMTHATYAGSVISSIVDRAATISFNHFLAQSNAVTVFSVSGTGAISSAAGISATTAAFSGALTYGGVTLSNAVTGTGNMVLSASPTFTGTITAAIANYSGLLSANAGLAATTGMFSGGVTSSTGTQLVTNGSTTTFATLTTIGNYLITVYNGANWTFAGFYSTGAAISNSISATSSVNTAFAISGTNVQIHNTTGGDITYNWSITRIS